MPLTAAEKQLRYRQKRDLDPSRQAAYLQKEREKYQTDLATGKRKRAKDMTDREHRSCKKKWKRQQASYRKKKRTLKERETNIVTPPASPEQSAGNQRGLHMSRQKKRDIAKCYRDNEKLRTDLEKEKRVNATLRKKLHREISKGKAPDTPRSRTRKLLRNLSVSKERNRKGNQHDKVRKTLLFHFALNEELKLKYRKASNKTKKSLSDLTRGKIMRKYKMIEKASKDLKFFRRDKKLIRKGNLTSRLDKQISEFYQREDNSRATAGVKETVTKQKVKRQKRILLTTIERLHEKFMLEHTDVKISYSSFSRRRPFWVVPPRETDRKTCLCKQHDNIQLLADALYKKKVLPTKELNGLVKMYTCDVKDMDCMYGRCKKCKDIRLPADNVDKNENVVWSRWQTVKEKRIIKNVEKEVNIVVKSEERGDMAELIGKFEEEMRRFKVHHFNVCSQIGHYQQLKGSLQSNEAMIHVDFSENYECKLSQEIQSMHYGASKKQITLHTGVYYTATGFTTFCAVSDSLEHGPTGIWAYLQPVLDKLFEENQSVDTLHFYSDGPSSQYKQKGNFFLLSKEVESRQIKVATWNFYESGHGKGVPDGVGGALKRAANSSVLCGEDITDAAAFVRSMKEKDSSVFVYEVKGVEVSKTAEVLESAKLIPIPGTYKIHQIKTSGVGGIWYRDISCRCEEGCIHTGHEWKFKKITEKETREKEVRTDVSRDCPLDLSPNESKIQRKSDGKDSQIRRKDYFKRALNELEMCRSFEDVEKKSNEISQEITRFEMNDLFVASVMNTGLSVDENALELYPSDTQQQDVLFPVQVRGDGNCLPYTGSIHAFGDEEHGEEIRVRIIVEAALNKDVYLKHDYLKQDSRGSSDLPKAYALYSDQYTPSSKLVRKEIERIYKNEIMNITKNKTYMGIWQLFALASVLGRTVISVYPCRGNVSVRKDLHRSIEPRVKRSIAQCYVMWTTTRNDMNENNWVPNHFVAVLPIETNNTNVLAVQRWKLMRQRKIERETLKKNTSVVSKTEYAKANEEDKSVAGDISGANRDRWNEKQNYENKKEQLQHDEEIVDKDKIEDRKKAPVYEEHIEEKGDEEKSDRDTTEELFTRACNYYRNDEGEINKEKEEIKTQVDHIKGKFSIQRDTDWKEEKNSLRNEDKVHQRVQENEIQDAKLDNEVKEAVTDIPSAHNLIGKHVLVKYMNDLFPGVVLDAECTEVYVRCMHRVGNKVENYTFYWPKVVKDECWYDLDDVLALIPEPQYVNRKYIVDQDILKSAIGKLSE